MSDARRKAKRPKNLLLDPDAVARGERYSRLHGTNLSRLVGDFLHALPLGAEELASSAGPSPDCSVLHSYGFRCGPERIGPVIG